MKLVALNVEGRYETQQWHPVQWHHVHSPKVNHSTLEWLPAVAPRPLRQSWPPPSPTIAHYNGTVRWHPAMAPRPLPQSWSSPSPSNHSTLQWHPAMAPRPLPQSWPSPSPRIAHYNGTVRWHPAMAPRPLPQSWSSPSPSNHGTLQWHPAMAPRPLPPLQQWHPGATSNLPKWFVALPFIGSKNPYIYRYLGKKSSILESRWKKPQIIQA